jgi:hypothetical protein
MSRTFKKSPYPALGTPHGDEVIGVCSIENCGAELKRGDVFMTMMSGKLGELVCFSCYSTLFKRSDP